jgi:hypothetical protein
MEFQNAKAVRGQIVYWQDHRKRLVYPYGIGKDVHVYHEDFLALPTDDTTGDPTQYTMTVVEVGAGNSTVVADDVSGGSLLITSAGNENDGAQIQLKGESFKLTSTCDLYFGAFGVELNDATESDAFLGLSITDTTILGGATDSIGFRKVDASTTLSYMLEKDSTETTGTAATLADDTAVDLEFYHTGGGSVEFFVNGASVGSSSTNLPDDEELRVSIAFLTGDASANTLKVKRITCVQIGT